MMKKKYVSRTIKILSFALAAFLIMTVTQVRGDHNKIRLDGFYMEEKNSLDVVLLGASEVYTAFSSALAYDEYGFTSYPYAIEANYIDLFESQIKEIRNNQTPKVLLIEMNGALYDNKMKDKDAKLRRFTDSMPFSQNKIDTVNQFGDKDEKLSYYFPWIMYHGSKSAIGRFPDNIALHLRGNSALKGVSGKSKSVFKGKIIDVEGDTSKKDLPAETEEKLRSFLQYCKDNKLENVVFAKFPHRITKKKFYKRFQMGNTMGEIIKEYGFDYLDFENNCKDVGLDYKEDFYNDDHMNIYGQQKFTKYLGKILVDKYGVEKSKLSEENKARWDASAEYIQLYYEYFEKCHKEGKDTQLYETCGLMWELDKLKKQKKA
ncbi:hypothetical protein [uncultured Ruminococcus sp.]|uniref:hypothetical protein n=1 Tax=uncultured Ruminococcus sp. TaxID=165186 RepID=UPI0025F6E465|nr:hypothetical protein [uncultured Ruminococcus sp.]